MTPGGMNSVISFYQKILKSRKLRSRLNMRLRAQLSQEIIKMVSKKTRNSWMNQVVREANSTSMSFWPEAKSLSVSFQSSTSNGFASFWFTDSFSSTCRSWETWNTTKNRTVIKNFTNRPQVTDVMTWTKTQQLLFSISLPAHTCLYQHTRSSMACQKWWQAISWWADSIGSTSTSF